MGGKNGNGKRLLASHWRMETWHVAVDILHWNCADGRKREEKLEPQIENR